MRRVTFQLRTVSLLLLAVVAAGCAGAKFSANGGTGTGGSGAGDCQTASCVPPVESTLTFAAEITPPVGSGAPLTEIVPVTVGGGSPIGLNTDTQVLVTATFAAASGGTVPGNANIVLDVPSQIFGRPNLTFQVPATVGTSPNGGPATTGQLPVPQKVVKLATGGTLSLLPLAPDDQQTPPYAFDVTVNTTTLPVQQLPSDNVSVTGTLVNSVAKQLATAFVARAFQGPNLVSSAPIVDATTGNFKLAIPLLVTSGNPVTVQLTPQSQTDPWFIFATPLPNPSPPTVALGQVMLRAYNNVNQFNVLVEGTDQSRVSGATVTAQTTLGSSTSSNNYTGNTSFGRSGVTDSYGTAVLSLLPGTMDLPVNYNLIAVPPTGSPWATTCSDPNAPAKAVGNGSTTTAGAQTLAILQLKPRTVVTGRVTDANGGPVANVAVTATPGNGPTANCPSTLPAPGTTTTNAQGTFTFPLDPGSYQLDYDPPAGSSAPRFTETGVTVTGSQMQHDRPLPQGGLVAGTILTAGQAPLASATVKLFEACSSSSGASCSSPPLLRGQAVTDSAGRFQIVVSLNQ